MSLVAGGEGLFVSFPFLTTRLTAPLCSDLVRITHFAEGSFYTAEVNLKQLLDCSKYLNVVFTELGSFTHGTLIIPSKICIFAINQRAGQSEYHNKYSMIMNIRNLHLYP